MPEMQKQFETFNDGLITICDAEERTITKNKLQGVRFGNRTVGIQRYWQAKTAGNKISKLIAIPLSVLNASLIEVQDIVILENDMLGSGQYQILQMQEKLDKKPPALYLSLEKVTHPLKDGRDGSG